MKIIILEKNIDLGAEERLAGKGVVNLKIEKQKVIKYEKETEKKFNKNN